MEPNCNVAHMYHSLALTTECSVPLCLSADNNDLGTACGKFYRVSVLGITDPGALLALLSSMRLPAVFGKFHCAHRRFPPFVSQVTLTSSSPLSKLLAGCSCNRMQPQFRVPGALHFISPFSSRKAYALCHGGIIVGCRHIIIAWLLNHTSVEQKQLSCQLLLQTPSRRCHHKSKINQSFSHSRASCVIHNRYHAQTAVRSHWKSFDTTATEGGRAGIRNPSAQRHFAAVLAPQPHSAGAHAHTQGEELSQARVQSSFIVSEMKMSSADDVRSRKPELWIATSTSCGSRFPLTASTPRSTM